LTGQEEAKKVKTLREKRDVKMWHGFGKGKRVVVFILLFFFLVYLSLFHRVRGEQIVEPSESEYRQAVARMVHGPVTVHSTKDMQDLGALAWHIVKQSGHSPGSFYVLFLLQLDTREKLHHLAHSPFTGLNSIYADIWLNSCTVYGSSESTWGIRNSSVYPADKLSVLLILIDRLKRGKTSLQEHFGAYIEVFSGMELDSLPGRARCWLILIKQCAKDDRLAHFVERQLEQRRTEHIDLAEWDLWNHLLRQPTQKNIELLAASDTTPVALELSKAIAYPLLFKKLLHEYRSEKR
jgi:hypothetical protein